ncbi:hypothetical protein [Kitasatospora sp. NPDC097691]|uniref:hypothetical protein n=1 Tax=Kitasatospora sp. NPDC097691 TaxID=3157231 RepID=UPI00331F3063
MRPRWVYGLFGLACAVLFVIAAVVGGFADERGIGWLSTVCVFGAGASLGIGLTMVGRAVLPEGRLRRQMFRFPPPRNHGE